MAALVLLLALVVGSFKPTFLSGISLVNLLEFWASFVFLAYAQQMVVLLGGMDLSVGPLTGCLAVVASFFFASADNVGSIVVGLVAMVGVALTVGLLHVLEVGRFRINPVGATLATMIGIQGLSLTMRPTMDGPVDPRIVRLLTANIGGWVPVVAVVAVLVGVGLELWLRYTRTGTEVRAYGSDEGIANLLGVRAGLAQTIAWVSCSLLTVLSALMLIAHTGIGDARQGPEFTLNAVVAVVLGGAALSGGRGSFLGVMIGSLLLQETVAMAPFLKLSQAWNNWFPGLLLVFAGLVYGLSRHGFSLLKESELAS
jgi:ribose transport system ATP-binding protein